MQVILGLKSWIFSKIQQGNNGARWTASQYSNVFGLHRFQTVATEDGEDSYSDDGDNDDKRGNSSRKCARSEGPCSMSKFKLFILLCFSFVLGIVSIRFFDRSSWPSGNPREATNATWPISSVWPVLGETGSEPHLYFPAQGSSFAPAVATYNLPPRQRPRTPLFIPFTRNNAMMKQSVLGYIASGWPREDIIILDNSGTLDANSKKLLSPSNPFFLDYDLFRTRYGVSILRTPVLLNFAQLQNFMLDMALRRDWKYYFWSHMDVGIISSEEDTPYKSLYAKVLEVLEQAISSSESGKSKWGVKFFNFDYLSLNNVDVWRKVGQWDVFIPYYATDCDFYERLRMLGFTTDEVQVGHIFDVANNVTDPETKFFPSASSTAKNPPRRRFGNAEKRDGDKDSHDEKPNSDRFKALLAELKVFEEEKKANSKGRNTWQNKQKGGQGEPWTYDPAGFQSAWWQMAEAGRKLYKSKWGTGECNLRQDGKVLGDMWKHV